jgi:Cu2+-exporting ATPase
MPDRAAEVLSSKSTQLAKCIHCGTPFSATPERPDYCCAGCQFVHDLIVKNGLQKFYDLQDGMAFPVKSLVFQKRDYSWLAELALASNIPGSGSSMLNLDLQGISCIGCVWLIEKLFERKPGALGAQVNPTLGQLHLRWTPGQTDIVEFAHELQSFGYLLGPPGATAQNQTGPLIKRLGLCGAFAMNAMLFTLPNYLGMEQSFAYAPLFNNLALLFSTLSFFVGGTYFFERTWHSLRNRVLHIDLPISLGLISAYSASIYAWKVGAMDFVYFDFVSIFTFLMLVGRWMQQSAIDKNRTRLLGMQSGPPEVLIGGAKQPAILLISGTRFGVNPGQVVPVRSKLLSEGATLGMEWINGEAEAGTARRGQLVASGAVNYSQAAIDLEATESWADSILCSLLQMTPRSVTKHTGLEQFIKIYIIVVLHIAVIGFGAWWWFGGALLKALQVMTSILVVSCPCAAGVALPLADEISVSTLRKLGVFVREQSLWVRINRVRKIVFDKTGTLTLETMAIENPASLANLPDNQKAILLAMVENSLHPVSCCLRESLLAEGVQSATPSQAKPEEIIGFGLELKENADIWRLGRPGWAGGRQSDRTDQSDPTDRSDPKAAQPTSDFPPQDCLFTRNGQPIAGFVFKEAVRSDAIEEVAALRKRGCEVNILSGDRKEKVAQMAAQLNLPAEQAQGELSPQDKADWVRKHDQRDTLMIGDGANDSLAFNESFCNGTPAIDRGLLEQKADFYFLGRGLSGVRQLLEMGRIRQHTVNGVIGFALIYNLVTIILSLAGKMSPLAASILMPCSSLISIAIVFQRCRR